MDADDTANAAATNAEGSTIALHPHCSGKLKTLFAAAVIGALTPVKFSDRPKISYTKISDKMVFVNGADPDDCSTESPLFAISLSVLRNSCINSKI